MRGAYPDGDMTATIDKRRAAIAVVIPFVFRHWLNQPVLALLVAGGLLGATVADLFMPVFSGHLVDAMTRGPAEPVARHDALVAFVWIIALGLLSMILRLSGLRAIVPFTLRIMSDVARDTFVRVQRFSTDWHANSFAGSTVRKITRGMWALDLLNDTILMALFPSLMVLVGSMILLGLHWASLGLVVALGAAIYVSMIIWFTTRYIAPAARVSNAWDTKVGGTLADALTCNAVVKSFGAEAREDERLARVVSRWRARVRRTWLRYNNTSTAQLAALLCMRASVIGGSLLLWMAGRASPGDVTYVLTSYYIIHAYLRDVGMHINNLQRSVKQYVVFFFFVVWLSSCAPGVALLRDEPLVVDFLRRCPAEELLGRVLVLRVLHHQVGLRAGQVELTAGTGGNAGMKDVILHRRAFLGQVGVGLLLRLKIDRCTVIRGADAAGEERAVVAGVIPGKPALVHCLFPQRDGELHRLDGLLGVEHHGLAVGLDLLAAPRPQVRDTTSPARRRRCDRRSGRKVGRPPSASCRRRGIRPSSWGIPVHRLRRARTCGRRRGRRRCTRARRSTCRRRSR